jgi:hypothetical protein
MSLWWYVGITMGVLFLVGAYQARRSVRHPSRLFDSEGLVLQLRYEHERDRAAQEHVREDHL